MNRPQRPRSGQANDGDEETLRDILERVASIHPAIVFGSVLGATTSLGCVLVLVIKLIMGSPSAPPAEVAGVTNHPGVANGTAPPDPSQAVPTREGTPSAVPASVAPGQDDMAVARLRLHTCAIGLLAYQNSIRTLPVIPAGTRGGQLSWRVHILPFLGLQELYQRFNLEEAWDGPTNSKLLGEMPALYKVTSADKSTTRYQIFTGSGSLFTGEKAKSLADITDGYSNTIAVALVKPSRAIPWTKPDDLQVTADATSESLGTVPDGTIEAATFDGQFVSLPANTPVETLRSLISPAGQEIVDAANFRPKSGLVSPREFISSGNFAELVALAMSGNATVPSDGAGQRGGASPVTEKMDKILLGVQLYVDTYRHLPVSSKLSWRVQILPFLQQNPLYDQFRQDEPWDSPHNQALIQHMPDVFRTDAADPNSTRFQVFAGAGTVFVPGKKPAFGDIQDGTANTLLMVHAGRDKASIWTKPDDLPFDPANPLAAVGDLGSSKLVCGMIDGTVVELPANLKPTSFTALVTPSGGEVVDVRNLAAAAAVVPANAPGAATAARIVTPDTLVDSERRIKQIALALHNFHDVNRHFPGPDGKEKYDAQGKPLLSWRVYLLPFLEQQALFDKFKLDEPWDSPNNKPLLEFMPSCYRAAGVPPNVTTTGVVVMTGPTALFEKNPGPRISAIRDGTSQTLLCLEVEPDKAVPWTQPVDVVFDPAQPLAAIGSIPPHGLTVARVDAAVYRLLPTVKAAIFAGIVSISGGEVLSDDDLRAAGFAN